MYDTVTVGKQTDGLCTVDFSKQFDLQKCRQLARFKRKKRRLAFTLLKSIKFEKALIGIERVC